MNNSDLEQSIREAISVLKAEVIAERDALTEAIPALRRKVICLRRLCAIYSPGESDDVVAAGSPLDTALDAFARTTRHGHDARRGRKVRKHVTRER